MLGAVYFAHIPGAAMVSVRATTSAVDLTFLSSSEPEFLLNPRYLVTICISGSCSTN